MGDNSKIEWTDATWNPIRARDLTTGGVGHWCVKISPGCKFCYAERSQPRFGQRARYAQQDRDKVRLILYEDAFKLLRSWHRHPRKVFVCSMTDLFLAEHPDDWIDNIFAEMALAPQHTFQVLTKRADRMRAYLKDITLQRLIMAQPHGDWPLSMRWPLPNVWLGVSAEDQERADERIPELLATSAAVRFVSYEPALGPIDFTAIAQTVSPGYFGDCLQWHHRPRSEEHLPYPVIDQIIFGGESGHDRRGVDLQWARHTLAQCREAGTAFYMKQVDKKAQIPDDLMVREMPK